MPLQTLRVIAFDGGFNLPIWVGQKLGIFEAGGLKVELAFVPNSGFLVTSLMDGAADVALAGFDNIVAYQERQGETALQSEPDLFAFMGGDSGFLTLMASPALRSFDDLRGKQLAVDAMTTGFAFALKEILARGGLGEQDVRYVKAGGTANRFRELMAGQHDATLLRTPFELLAAHRGFNALATASDTLGAYMGTVGATSRRWARANEDRLLRFLKTYRAALDWVAAAGNRAQSRALLVEHMADLEPTLAGKACDLLLDEKAGFIRDLRLDCPGMQTVLALRSKYGQPAKQLTDAARYVDTSYLSKAFGGVT